MLILGLYTSIIVSIHDSLLSLGFLFYSFPVIYLGYVFEAVRFTAVYQREALIRAGKLQGELNRSAKIIHIGQITSSIFHDIKNPLGVIFLNTNRLKKKVSKATEDERLTADFSNIEKNVHKINKSFHHISTLPMIIQMRE